MGVRILHAQAAAVLYCSTTDWAFGPVFYDSDTHDAEERAQAFCDWMGQTDPRALDDSTLESLYNRFLSEGEQEYWKKKYEEEVIEED